MWGLFLNASVLSFLSLPLILSNTFLTLTLTQPNATLIVPTEKHEAKRNDSSSKSIHQQNNNQSRWMPPFEDNAYPSIRGQNFLRMQQHMLRNKHSWVNTVIRSVTDLLIIICNNSYNGRAAYSSVTNPTIVPWVSLTRLSSSWDEHLLFTKRNNQCLLIMANDRVVKNTDKDSRWSTDMALVSLNAWRCNF